MKALALGVVVTLGVAGCGLRTDLLKRARDADGAASDSPDREVRPGAGEAGPFFRADAALDRQGARDATSPARDGVSPARDAARVDRPIDQGRPPLDAPSFRDAFDGADRSRDTNSAAQDAASPDRAVPPDARPDLSPSLLDFRPTLPLSTSVVTSRRPTFAWTDPGNVQYFVLEICRDPKCANVLGSFASGSISYTLTSPLGEGPIFWRVRGVLQTGPEILTDIWEIFVGSRSSLHDTSMLAIPDYNRDGHPDVAQGTVGGLVSVTPFGLGPVPLTLPVILPGPARSLAYAVDVNADGYGDLLLGRPGAVDIFYGYELGLSYGGTIEGSPGFATTAAGVGDIDGDGFGDVVVGTADGGQGKATVYRGSRNGLSATPSGSSLLLGRFGAAGDVDGDGFADVVTCAPVIRTAFLLPGGPTGLTPGVTLPDPRPGGATSYGNSCQGVGDVNGDGLGDVVVTGADAELVAVLFYGSPSRSPGVPTVLTLGSAMGRSADAVFVSSAGDLNHDGYGDLVIADGIGVRVFLGAAAGVAAMPFYAAAGDFRTVVGVGDINGDRFGDVLVAPNDCSQAVQIWGGGTGGLDLATLYAFPRANPPLCPRHLIAR